MPFANPDRPYSRSAVAVRNEPYSADAALRSNDSKRRNFDIRIKRVSGIIDPYLSRGRDSIAVIG